MAGSTLPSRSPGTAISTGPISVWIDARQADISVTHEDMSSQPMGHRSPFSTEAQQCPHDQRMEQ
jgi:hypothetical protein